MANILDGICPEGFILDRLDDWPRSASRKEWFRITRELVATITLARFRSVASLRCKSRTAWATTATAATSKPRTQPPSIQLGWNESSGAASTINTAEGNVNPAQAARPPSHPARIRPKPIPTCELEGPGSS